MTATAPERALIEPAAAPIVGALLLDCGTAWPIVTRHLTAADFSGAAGAVFESVARLVERRGVAYVSLITVGDDLRRQGRTDIDGLLLAELVDAAPPVIGLHLPGIVEDYAAAIRARKAGALMQDAGRRLAAVDPLNVAAYLRGVADELRGLADGVGQPVEVIDAADYADTEPPPADPILGDLFDAGDKVPIIGSSKARKTFFALQLSISLAAGLPEFLYWPIPKRRRVLFFNLEVKGAHFHNRVYRMARNMGVNPADLKGHLFIVNGRGRSFTAGDMTELARKHGAEAVILDPTYKLLTGDENNAADMKPLLAGFDRICEETGAAIIYVHHNAKGRAGDRDTRDRGAGSGVLARDFDAALYIADHLKGEPLLVLSALLRNYPPTPARSIAWDAGRFVQSDEAPIELTSASAKKLNGRPAVEAAAVHERFKSAGPLTVGDAVAMIRGMGAAKDAARDLYRRMLSDGLLLNWQEPVLHGSTWLGTAEQIKQKRADWDAARQHEMDFQQERRTKGTNPKGAKRE